MGPSPRGGPLARLAAGPGLLALLVFVGAMFWVDSEASWLYHGGFLVLSAVFAVVVLAVSDPGLSGPLAGLGAPPLRWIGQRSYGIYLWHFPVIILLAWPQTGLRGWVLPGFQIAVTFSLAAVSYTIVERPARRAHRPALVVAGGAASPPGRCSPPWWCSAQEQGRQPARSRPRARDRAWCSSTSSRRPNLSPASSVVVVAPPGGGSVETVPSTTAAPGHPASSAAPAARR